MPYVPEKIGEASFWTKSRLLSWMREHPRLLKRAVWSTAFLLVVGAISYQIVDSWQEIRTYPWHWNLKYIFWGFGVYSLSLLATAGIWTAIIRRLAGLKPVLPNIGLYCLTNLAQRLPTPLPYVGARTEAYAARGVPRTTTLAAMSLEIIVTIVGALVTALITLPFGFPESMERFNLLIWLLVLPLVVFILRPNWLFKVINSILRRLKRPGLAVQVGTPEMLIWVVIFILIWLNGGFLYYLLANSIYPIRVDELLAMINVFAVSGVIGWLGQLFFFLPSVGLRQVAVAYLLSFFIPWPVAVAVALLTRLSVMIFELIWALGFSLIFSRQLLSNDGFPVSDGNKASSR
jgi:hypothetical protein